MNKRHVFIGVLITIIMFQNCANTNESKNSISTVKKNRVILIPRSDTITLGDYYGTEIHVPDYDSYSSYSCLVGNFEMKVNNKDTILQMVSNYDSLFSSRVPGIYYLQTKPSKTGNLSFTGFIRKTKQDEIIYFPFEDSFYVK